MKLRAIAHARIRLLPASRVAYSINAGRYRLTASDRRADKLQHCAGVKNESTDHENGQKNGSFLT